jgi:uncharacterized membrane protein
MPELNDFPPQLAQTRRYILTLYYALLVYFAVNSVAALGASIAVPVVWLLQTVPLLIFLPGLRRGNARSYAWLSFVILLYFIHGVLLAFDAQRRVLGFIEVLLCVALFVYLILFIRAYRTHFNTGI